MSKQGKAIAIIQVCLESAESLLNVIAKTTHMTGIAGPALLASAKTCADFRISTVQQIPHQHFNAKGKIDKRKVRRHDRKQGINAHPIRTIGWGCADLVSVPEITLTGDFTTEVKG